MSSGTGSGEALSPQVVTEDGTDGAGLDEVAMAEKALEGAKEKVKKQEGHLEAAKQAVKDAEEALESAKERQS